MRRFTRIAVAGVLGLVVLGSLATPALAEVVDNYCSPSGDYCTRIVEKASGTFVFKIVGFADYFGNVDACVTKDTEACETVRPREGGNDLFTWKIAWQGNFPDQGPGRYTLKWFDEGNRIGTPLHFRVA